MFRDPQKKMSSKKEMMMQCAIGMISAIVTSYALPTLFANVRRWYFSLSRFFFKFENATPTLILLKNTTQITALLSAFIGILFWGRNLQPVTAALGSVSMIFMSFSVFMTFALMCRADSLFTYFIPVFLFFVLGGFITRLIILYRQENKWLFQTKKNDGGNSSTYLPAISSESYDNGTDV